MSEQERTLETLRVELWAQTHPDVAAAVMGLGLASVRGASMVTWSASPSSIVLAGGDRQALLTSVGSVSANLRGLARDLGTGRLSPDALASRLSLYASHAHNMAAQIASQETVKWQASARGLCAGREAWPS